MADSANTCRTSDQGAHQAAPGVPERWRLTERRRFVSSATTRILQFSGVRESRASGPRLRRTDERNAERALVAQRVHDPLSPAAARTSAAPIEAAGSYRSPLTRVRLACSTGPQRAFNRDHSHKLSATIGPAQPRIRPPAAARMSNAAIRRTAALRSDRRHRRALQAP
jgi:hypothetical protein